jgi:hypothetical protein
LRIRIKETPRQHELDGMRLDSFTRGSVREVSPSVGAWLVLEGYAEPEMRWGPREDDMEFSGFKDPPATAQDCPRRRSTDR